MDDVEPEDRCVRFLLVDDSRANLLVLESLLAAPDRELVSVLSGSEAIDEVRRRSFDLVLLDAHMPRLDGFDTARMIRKLENGRDLPIIMLTAVYREDTHVRKGYAAGVSDYLTKPLDATVLAAKVRIYARLHEQARRLRAAERRAAETEAAIDAMHRVLTLVSDAIVVTDATGHVVMLNERASRLLGVRPGDALRVHGAEGIELQQTPVALALETGEITQRAPHELDAPDGTLHEVRFSAAMAATPSWARSP